MGLPLPTSKACCFCFPKWSHSEFARNEAIAGGVRTRRQRPQGDRRALPTKKQDSQIVPTPHPSPFTPPSFVRCEKTPILHHKERKKRKHNRPFQFLAKLRKSGIATKLTTNCRPRGLAPSWGGAHTLIII